ncbi:2-hydroxychromene-2-carboxylate isomerase [uncultured Tateyamaria sp.]|uniref:2-hydroxychromene-2-carboxylate isomerase n=1 Tax=uncultured Tateyamaria sp. TaxID=455651 RepID=UPI0026207F24|nr:2-hydroxychromene-2-carboxylate isomerase [uncultured Tateyamaria sp.]
MTELTYFYSAHSAFAYLGSRRLMRICADHGLTLVHRPIPLSPVVEAQGSLPFAQRTQAHVDYFFGREIERWAEWRDVPIVPFRPTHHDADYNLASWMILALGDRGPHVDALAHAILEAHWRDDADLSDASTLRSIATALGHDAETLMDRARGQEIAARYEKNAQDALTLNVMGSPTYVLGAEAFYGQDRLEMLERAITNPFAPTRWTNPPVQAT